MPELPDGWTPGGPLTARSLKTEYAVRPLGTEVTRPRLSWIATAPGYGATQTAYQILVATAPELLTPESADVWDSGQVSSARTFGVEYERPGWRRVLATTGPCACGMDSTGPASGPRPSGSRPRSSMRASPRLAGSAARSTALRCSAGGFVVDGTVRRARLYASGLGYADLRLNGQAVTDAVLDPGFTAYDHTVLYVTHDITELLQAGDNVVGAELGRGFFGLTSPNVWRWHRRRGPPSRACSRAW